MENTPIGWTQRKLPDGTVLPGHTFNGWFGCFKVGPGCKHCYAEGIAKRYGHNVWGPAATTDRLLLSEANWRKPLKWNKEAEQLGHRISVFCGSMMDVFEDHPQVESKRERLWNTIAITPWLNWLLLTKRPENILAMAPWARGDWPDNVWAGCSVENQEKAEERLPHLLNVSAAVRFVSYEPALEEVNFRPFLYGLNWIICGGESGPKYRPFDLDWARSARDQVLEERSYGHPNLSYYFKQVGGLKPTSGGRLLDGVTWDEMPPEVPPVDLEKEAEDEASRYEAADGSYGTARWT